MLDDLYLGHPIAPERQQRLLSLPLPPAGFALLTALIFTATGSSASKLAGWLSSRPRVIKGVNIGAGLTFIAAGPSVLTLKQRA